VVRGGRKADGSDLASLVFVAAVAPVARSGVVQLPSHVCRTQDLHDGALRLVTHACSAVFPGAVPDLTERLAWIWDELVRPLFTEGGGHLAFKAGVASPLTPTSAAPRSKPLVALRPVHTATARAGSYIAGADNLSPMGQAKALETTFIGSSRHYIFCRLYHVLSERLSFAREMAFHADVAKERVQEAKKRKMANGDPRSSPALLAGLAEPGTPPEKPDVDMEAAANLAPGAYGVFLQALRQLMDNKLDANVYEDLLRKELGTPSYILFTLHKVLQQMVKQLQVLLDTEAGENEHLITLFKYERMRACSGSANLLAYEANVRALLDDDECYAIAQSFQGTSGHLVCSLITYQPEAKAEQAEAAVAKEEDEADEAEDEAAVERWSGGVHSFVSRPLPTAVPGTRRARPVFLRSARARVQARSPSASVSVRGLEARFQLRRGFTGRIAFLTGGADVFVRLGRKGLLNKGAAGVHRRAASKPEASRPPANRRRKADTSRASPLLERCEPFVPRPAIRLSADFKATRS